MFFKKYSQDIVKSLDYPSGGVYSAGLTLLAHKHYMVCPLALPSATGLSFVFGHLPAVRAYSDELNF